MTDIAIGPGTVVVIHYDLKDAEGRLLETSAEREPVTFLYGERGVLASLQEAMRGRRAGEELEVTIPHERGYGRRYPDRVRRVPRKAFEGGKARRFRVGEIVALREASGPVQATIVKVGKFQIDVDTNHPLAGRDLAFDVRVQDVREASDEERAHGHAHGPGGHHH